MFPNNYYGTNNGGDVAMVNQNGGAGDGSFDRTKLIVNYIPQFTTEEDLMGIFMQVGDLESIRIMRNPRSGYSYGYGFVKYIKEEDAAKAIENFNGLQFRNKNLKVSYSRPPSQATKDSNLYISNLPKEFTEDNLVDMFCKYGEIIQKNLLKDKNTGLPRGVAFVRFARGDEAQAAIAELDGLKLDNCPFPISVRVADDHTKQRSQMIEQQMHMCNRQDY
ncbi:PREDICTED: sex-lethal homolog isoform X2 [Nicrophorus vespilloides]|uniref:Sex-lethal homolog isoform X2 n=1 Tax=Nicrophorus vespilloides TaxID=110193 RepID=A0ABM1N3L4_NICVS|nr:PREDICTED: sex-lethal homolog isoform X2 [Nicrophorus vespilloides]